MRHARLVLLMASLVTLPAQAGMFDDDEARKRIADLKTSSDARFDTQAKALLELSSQIQSLREDNAKLRGQIETLTYELDLAKKRQQDFYLDLDTRLRKFEGGGNATADTAPKAAAAGDPAGEALEYEAALGLFKGKKFKEAAAAFAGFVTKYPESNLAASAQFWQGNAWYAQGDCKRAIDTQLVVSQRWPDSGKAPDSLLAVAGCQQDMGNAAAAKRTLETLLAKYPDAPAAGQARQRLKK